MTSPSCGGSLLEGAKVCPHCGAPARSEAPPANPLRARVMGAVAIGVLAFLAYNANGREVGSYDSQPTKLAARELLLRRTLALDHVVAATPEYARRPGFARAIDGSVRSAYSVVPALEAAGLGALLWALGVVDPEAPLAASLIAKLTASLLTSVAVALAFLTARRRVAGTGAALVALGFGLGTNLWAIASQSLWQHETAILGLAAATFLLARPGHELTPARLWTASLMLGLAGAARPQLAPAIAVLAVSICVRTSLLRGLGALLPLALVTAAVLGFNLAWFGHPLGAFLALESLHPAVHGVAGTFSAEPWRGAGGLLFSPSRGLLVFSPIVAVAIAGMARARREGWESDLAWSLLAAGAQFALYASYAVWWGGHTYGPRYCLDLLPHLVPLAAAGLPAAAATRPRRGLAWLALTWSVLIAATGAFSYPDERWNVFPTEVDTNHERLWDWKDPQFVRCWSSGSSPGNFRLFDMRAVRR